MPRALLIHNTAVEGQRLEEGHAEAARPLVGRLAADVLDRVGRQQEVKVAGRAQRHADAAVEALRAQREHVLPRRAVERDAY